MGFFPLLSRHVFKRLKFLGNKALSQVMTLLFLTIWHGLHSGYIMCFSMEFFIMTVERQVRCGSRADGRINVRKVNMPFNNS